MTTAQVNSLIKSIGIPSAYHHFSEATAKEPPFICFYYPGSADFYADNINYQRINQLTVELYTEEKDFDLESRVEAALTGAELPWVKTEVYIDSEKMYMTTYDTEVLINA